MTQDRATAWSITINNPISADEENIALARQRGWKVEGQLEKGESGTPHYQLLVKTPQVRFSAVKSQFPRSHIEKARNVAALTTYVKKEDTRVGTLSSQQDRYPSLSKSWELFTEWIDERRLLFAALSWSPDEWLEQYDNCISDLIADGYHVESIAVNPGVRSAVKKFGYSITCRSRNEINAKLTQTDKDRQTPENIVAPDIQNALEERNDEVENEDGQQTEGGGTEETSGT